MEEPTDELTQECEQEGAQEPRITTTHLPPGEKNPGRMAAGKRLAEWNRVNRAKKKAAANSLGTDGMSAAHHPPVECVHDTHHAESAQSSGYRIIGLAGLVVSLVGLYMHRQELVSVQKELLHLCVLKSLSSFSKIIVSFCLRTTRQGESRDQ